MRYWDSSALVPLLVEEQETASLEELLRLDGEVITWWGSYIECASALTRLHREGALSEDALRSALGDLDRFSATWVEIKPHDRVQRVSLRLLRTHVLRAADSLQLAAAVVTAENRPLEFVCRDRGLARAADTEGFTVR